MPENKSCKERFLNLEGFFCDGDAENVSEEEAKDLLDYLGEVGRFFGQNYMNLDNLRG
jgi:hypothetical protein